MSNINYDVLYPVNYDSRYKHYLARYKVGLQPYKVTKGQYVLYSGYEYQGSYEAAVSFDDGNEITANGEAIAYRYAPGTMYVTVQVQEPGPFNRVYIRNTHPEQLRFTTSNTFFSIEYLTKGEFEVQFNSTGFASNQNAVFRCSTVPKNILAQYEWKSAIVYYKKSTEGTYRSANAVVSGTWSDVSVSLGFGFEDGYTYDVYIKATADDGTTAQTPVAQFSTVDAQAIATCLAPVGSFTNGEVKFIWSHTTDYGTPQYAYDLRYSADNGGSWVELVNHAITSKSFFLTTIDVAANYIWQVRTYNTNDVPGEWVQASFVNNVPAKPPTNINVTTEGRPTVSWSSSSQSAYQIQAMLGDSVVYDSGAVYSAQTNHIINKYLYDNKMYIIRVRIYNALGDVSEWVEKGYQQPEIPDVTFEVEQDENGGVDIIITENSEFIKYYILRNGKPIAVIDGGVYYDRFAVGDVTYSVIGITSRDNSDIETIGFKAIYPKATIVTLSGETFAVNKRFNETYAVDTATQINFNKAQYIGDTKPTHYTGEMITKAFSISCFDENDILESLLGQTVFYADNFGNGDYCFVTGHSKQNDYLQLQNKKYANETVLTLEVTNYDDSIEYAL